MEASGSGIRAALETEFLCDQLLDQSQQIAERYRALFSLRNLSGPAVLNGLIQAMRDSSNLLAHESAFALGQMQEVEAVPALERVLEELSLHAIVRQAAAESLGVIGLERSIPILKRSLDSDPAEEVRGTCELALRRMEEKASRGQASYAPSGVTSPFLSVDPVLPEIDVSSVGQLRKVLLDEDVSLYKRYAALFALRDHGGKEAVDAIISSLGAGSPLLRHEVAYVLGQLQDKAASAALSAILKDISEHPMVRYEAAEALGSIADQASASLLKEFTRDVEPIVSQSCEVALSMMEFERGGKSFEFLYMQTPQVM